MPEDQEGRERGRIDVLLSRGLVAWVDGVRRHARAVLAAVALVTVGLGGYAATHLGINTYFAAVLDDDLPFWQDYNEFGKVFPILDEALLVVIDAETPRRAQDAADALAARLAEQTELFRGVYVPGGGEFFEKHALLYLSVDELQDLADQLAGVQPILAEITRDRSLRNMANVLRQGIEHARTHPGAVGDMSAVFDSLSVAAAAVLEGRPRATSWTELLIERTLPGDRARRLVVLDPSYDYERLLPGRRAMLAVRTAADELGLDERAGVDVRITGNVALNTEEMVVVAWQSAYAAVGCFLLVGAVLFVALRSWRVAIAILAALLVGLVATAAFAALAVGKLNVVSVAFAVLFIGLGVDFGIHLGMRFAERVRDGDDVARALAETCRSVGGSLILCALTTAIGFYVFIPTDYRAVAELGLISGTGMLISLASSLTVMPAILATTTGSVGRAWRGAPWFERVLVGIAVRHPRNVRIAAAVLAVPAAAALYSVISDPDRHFDHNVVKLRDPSTESVQAFEDLLSASDTSPWTIDVMAPDLARAVATAERLRELEVVERAITLRDWVPTEQEDKLETLADMAMFVPPTPSGATAPAAPVADQIEALRALQEALRSPWLHDGDPQRAASAERAAGYLERFLARLQTVDEKRQELDQFEQSLTGSLPRQMKRLWQAIDADEVELADLPDDLASRFVAPDGRARVQVLASGYLGDLDAFARFVEGVQAVAPHATGSAVSLLYWGRVVVESFLEALGLAVLSVALLLWLLWRRIADMAFVLLPLLLAMSLTAATAFALGIDFNFGNVLVLPLLLGVGVDSGIHLVHRHRVARGREMESAAPEVELLGTSTAQAVLFSALTTMGSFGTLALSTHPGLASLGQLLLIGVIYTLICNLIVLPALIARKAA
jgi:hopanoid biosynthesis associated RND transporter like protein HpnN